MKFCWPTTRAAEKLTKTEFVMMVFELENHTFDIGNAKYATKYKKTAYAIANYIHI